MFKKEYENNNRKKTRLKRSILGGLIIFIILLFTENPQIANATEPYIEQDVLLDIPDDYPYDPSTWQQTIITRSVYSGGKLFINVTLLSQSNSSVLFYNYIHDRTLPSLTNFTLAPGESFSGTYTVFFSRIITNSTTSIITSPNSLCLVNINSGITDDYGIKTTSTGILIYCQLNDVNKNATVRWGYQVLDWGDSGEGGIIPYVEIVVVFLLIVAWGNTKRARKV